MKFIMKVLLFRVPVYPFFETSVLFKDIFIIIRHNFSYIFSIFVVYLLYHIRLIRLRGAIESNPDPKPSLQYFNFLVFHWNLNSITSQDCLKIKLLTMYNVTHKFDITCIAESYLNSETLSGDDYLNIHGYKMFGADYPSGNRCGEFVFITMSLCLLKL